MLRLTTEFANRAALIEYVRQLSGAAMEPVSDIQGGLTQACQKCAALNPIAYQRDRNFFTGSVSVLSPYIRHGVILSKSLAEQLAERYPPSQRARWFLQHLIDGDIVCNNYSWQWVASTFSAKPYFFNLDNLRHYADGQLDCEHQSHRIFDASYDELSARLFPHLTDARGK